MAQPYEGVGFFQDHWRNPPAPFNPAFDPLAKARSATVTASMERDNFYATHSRDECKAEWNRRYDEAKAREQQTN